jgi:hypothetical protein
MRSTALIAALLIITFRLSSQENESPVTLSGYITNMQSVIFTDADKDWVIDNLIHNRLNLHWYPSEHFNASIQIRNRLLFGESITADPDYAGSIGNSQGLADLSFNLLSGESFVLNSNIDRLWLQFSTGNFVATAGRQRINWGQTFVWNANDIFNAYSYFDFDYAERPGSDAIRLQYYPNYTSILELAVKADSSGKVTAAGMYRFNIISYDFQFIAGILQEQDYLAGMGWSGIIGPAGFRGEGTYFHPMENTADTTGIFMTSVGIDYTFENSLFLQAEYLYSSNPLFTLEDLTGNFTGQLSVKQLAFTEHTLFASLSYPATPLLQVTMAGMYFPGIKGAFAGPSFSYNAFENVDLGLFIQYFNAELPDHSGGGTNRQDMTLSYLRLKWNF